MRVRTAILFLIVILTISVYGQETPKSASFTEYEIKAAFLYNFAKFVQWPPQAFAHDSTALQIGILGRDPFGSFIDRIVAGKRIESRKLYVRRYLDIREVENCQVLYISRSQERWLPEITRQARAQHILTVGESDSFLEVGGIIRLLTEGNKVRFEIDPKHAAESELVISSRLLRLAQNLRYTYSNSEQQDSSSVQD